MVSISSVAGPLLLGLAIGLAAGLSTTEGTTRRAIGVLGVLAGGSGIVGWTQGAEDVGVLVSALAIGFILGMAVGIYYSGTLPKQAPPE